MRDCGRLRHHTGTRDGLRGHHDHIVCVQCGHVEEFYDAEIEKRQSRIAKERGFTIREHSLYIYADCTKQNCPYRDSGGGKGL